MRLLLEILALPILGPIKGLKAIGEQVVAQMEAEQQDEKALMRRLTELQLLRDAGGIEDSLFEQEEERVLRELTDVRRKAA